MKTKEKEFLLKGEDYFLVIDALKTLYEILWDSQELDEYTNDMIKEVDELLTKITK